MCKLKDKGCKGCNGCNSILSVDPKVIIAQYTNPVEFGTGEQPKKIRRFPSGAVRSDDSGRPKPAFFSPYALEAVGELLSNNENDFGAANFWKGIPEEECEQSLMRHYCIYGKAKHTGDSELQFKEAVAMLFNAQALVHTMCIKREGVYKELHDKTELI